MKNYTVLFVDDEEASLRGLQQKVKRFYPQFKVQGAFRKPKDAITSINNHTPDILFLDIEMPHLNGFELLNNIPDCNAEVIFVTAYNKYALEALKQNAVDYILKPVANDELKIAVDKAIKNLEIQNAGDLNSGLKNLLEQTLSKKSKLLIPTQKGMSFIPQNEVFHLEGHEGYTKIHLSDASEILSSYNLGRFQKMLGTQFFKSHKSHIVNVEYVREFENEGYLILNNGKRVPISKANRTVFKELF